MTIHLSTQDRSSEQRSLHSVCELKQEERVDLSFQRRLRSVISLLLTSASMACLDECVVNRADLVIFQILSQQCDFL
jgi:hypothetical protein